MPGGDRAGPRGFGPRTGRGAGYCAGYDAPGCGIPGPGIGNRAYGYGRRYGRESGGRWSGGWGRGAGWGWRRRFYATGQPGWGWEGYGPATPQDEIAALKEDAEWLKSQLEAVNQRIAELEKD
jgi:hypothetical protein